MLKVAGIGTRLFFQFPVCVPDSQSPCLSLLVVECGQAHLNSPNCSSQLSDWAVDESPLCEGASRVGGKGKMRRFHRGEGQLAHRFLQASADYRSLTADERWARWTPRQLPVAISSAAFNCCSTCASNGCAGQSSVPERHGQVMHGDSASGDRLNTACSQLSPLFADKTQLP